jgi:glycerol-3-phosphate dehydrogenase
MIRLGRTLKSQHRNASRSWYIASTSAIATTGFIGTIYFAQTSKDVATETERAPPTFDLATTKRINVPTRDNQIQRLSSGESFDVLVIGGGATGSGAALDSTTRGLSTALIERADFGNETSSRSTKLIWAGIRYIATATASLLRFKNFLRPVDAVTDFVSEFQMVRNCHKERRLLLENNPHLTNWVPIAVPLEDWITWPAPFGHPLFCIAPLVLPAVFKFYDGMSGFTCPGEYTY